MGEMDVVCGRSPGAQKQITYMTKPSPVRIYSSAPPSEGKEIQSSFLEKGGEIYPLDRDLAENGNF
jgi:hypothetical protein